MNKVLSFERTPEIYLRMAQSKIDEGDEVGAIRLLHQGLLRHKKHPALLKELAECYCDLEVPAYALNVWYRYLTVCPKRDLAEAYNGLGRCYYALEDDVSAEYCFGQQIIHTKDYSSLAEDEAFLYYFGEKGQPAQSRYYIAHPAEEWQVTDFLSKARNAATRQAWDEAEDYLDKIPYESEDYPDALNLRAACASAKGDNLRAEQLLLQLVKEEPERARWWFSLANLYAIQNDFTRADASMDKVLELRPYDVTYLYFAGLTAHNAGDDEKAKRLLLRECDLAPDESVGHYYLNAVEDYLQHPEKPRAPFPYMPDVPNEERRRRVGLLAGLSGAKKKQISEMLRNPETANVVRWGFSLDNEEFSGYLSAVLVATGAKEGVELIEELLLKTGVSPTLKREMLRLLAFAESLRHTDVTFGFLHKKVKFYKFEIEEKDTIPVRLAYARAFGTLAYLLERADKFGEKLRDVSYDFYHRAKDREILKYFDDERALACVLHLKCAFEGLSRSIGEVARTYGADKQKVKEYLEMQQEKE